MAYNINELMTIATTERQKFILNTIIKEGGIRPAARKLNLSNGTINKMIKNLCVKLANSKEEVSTANTESITATSTLYDDKGNVKLQWVKRDAKANALMETISSAIDSFKSQDFRSPVNMTPRPLVANGLLAQYTFADYHLGMMAFEEESGEDWNTDKAVARITSIIDDMVEMTPPTEHAVINILGDFLHSDSLLPVTPKSRNVLDQDKRYPELIRIAVRTINYMVQKVRTKAGQVNILISQGNHDPIGSLWLQELFDYYYEKDDSVFVLKSASPFHCIEFGSTMLLYHHGDKIQFDKMHQYAPSLYPEIWGRTKYRYCHMGDKHHHRAKEGFGIVVEQHQTLAPRDAYSASHGWTSESGANVIIYSRESGELSRMTFRPKR